ncbi:HAD family hydrolase [Streptomyces sp. NPDC048282]|uniref:HAD family hydrolase n=1 Tax=Streptomyces sp. NPDC048282 TaxID=3365528 RepID=UPI003714C48B
MTDYLGDVEEARKLIERSRCLLFDFDGPICRLFPEERSSAPVAAQLRNLAAEFDVADVLTDEEGMTIDPHVVLRAVHRAGHDRDLSKLLSSMEETLTAGELEAAGLAEATPYSVRLVQHLYERGHRLAIVTNNSAEAARRYLSRADLLPFFETIEGRTAPGLMKPDPDVLRRALHHLGVAPGDAVMVGDSGTDLYAARAAEVNFIGYGRNERKVRSLRQAGAPVVVCSYRELL